MNIIRVEIRDTEETQEGSSTDSFCWEYWEHLLVFPAKIMKQIEHRQESKIRKEEHQSGKSKFTVIIDAKIENKRNRGRKITK